MQYKEKKGGKYVFEEVVKTKEIILTQEQIDTMVAKHTKRLENAQETISKSKKILKELEKTSE